MDIEKFAGSKFYMIFDMFYKFMIINLLWFFTVLIGLGVLTWLPATFAAYFVISSIRLQSTQLSYIKGYWVAFKRNYLKYEYIFIIILIVGFLLRFNIIMYTNVIAQSNSFIYLVGYGVTLFMIILLAFVLIHIFFVGLYFPEYKVFKTLKYALIFAFLMPFRTFSTILVGVLILGIVYLFPPLLPLLFFIFFSVHVFLTIKIIKPKYEKILKDKQPIGIDDYV